MTHAHEVADWAAAWTFASLPRAVVLAILGVCAVAVFCVGAWTLARQCREWLAYRRGLRRVARRRAARRAQPAVAASPPVPRELPRRPAPAPRTEEESGLFDGPSAADYSQAVEDVLTAATRLCRQAATGRSAHAVPPTREKPADTTPSPHP